MKLTKIWLTGLALSLALSLAAQTPLQDTIPETVVTATDTSHLLKDVPVQTEVITRQMLQNYAGRSLEDILGGLGNSYILILIDGKRIHGDVGGENDLSLVDPQNIEKIEIVKGASSALYGSDAIAGVINIITRKHREEGLLLENGTRNGSYNDLLAQLKPGDKAALLLVHFGTTYAETQARTIDAINAKARETFPQLTVAEAWTSRIILRKLKGRGIAKQTPLEALLLSNTLLNFLGRPQFIAYRIGPKPLSVRFAELLGAMKVAWTSRSYVNEKRNDAVIFEFYRPRARYQ